MLHYSSISICLCLGMLLGWYFSLYFPRPIMRLNRASVRLERRMSRVLMRMCNQHCKSSVSDLCRAKNGVDKEAFGILADGGLADFTDDGFYRLRWDRLIESQ